MFQTGLWHRIRLTVFLVALLSSGMETVRDSRLFAETRIIPSVSASERYDTNVWFAPKEFLPAGTQTWDFVTSVAPQVEVLNKSRLGDTQFNVGVSGNYFVNNPILSFYSTNAGLNSDLTGWIRELIPGAKLQISDSFLFTPEPPGFVTGVKPQDTSDAFTRGVIAFRANTYTNYATVAGEYAFARTFGMKASYTSSIFTVGQVLQAQSSTNLQSLFFDTVMHSGSIGPWYKLTRRDTLSLNYQPTYMSLTGEGTALTFTAHSLVAGYTKETPDWTLSVDGGPAYLEQGSLFFYNGRVTFVTNYDKSTRLRLTLSRQLSPSFFATGGALISNAAGLSFESKVAKDLTVAVTANYAENVSAPVETVEFKSLLTGIKLTYQMTRNLSSSIGYDYNFIDISSGTGAELQQFGFDRHVITFSLSSKWK